MVCVLPVCVTDDPDLARDAGPRGSSRSTASCRPTGRCSTGRAPTGPADVAIVGDEDTVAGQIRALAEAGVTDFVAGEFARGEDETRTRAVLKSLIAEPPDGRSGRRRRTAGALPESGPFTRN